MIVFCNNLCLFGRYGDYCLLFCEEICVGINNICERLMGVCLIGCDVGYFGNNCLMVCFNCDSSGCYRLNGMCVVLCKLGYYGFLCNCICSLICDVLGCVKDSGFCWGSCRVGYFGSFCEN